jgi:hypothetical protein
MHANGKINLYNFNCSLTDELVLWFEWQSQAMARENSSVVKGMFVIVLWSGIVSMDALENKNMQNVSRIKC